MLLLHGDNLVQSRVVLREEIAQAKASGHIVHTLTAKSLSVSDLEAALFTDSLFAEPKTVVIEELHSLPKSAKRDQLISLVANAAAQNSPNLILWDKKSLLVSDLKKFPSAVIRAFPASKAMFQWLDSWSGKASASQVSRQLDLLQTALAQDGAEFCLTMAAWKVRQLLEAATSRAANGKPLNPRAVSQAKSFSEDQLWKLHQAVTLLDLRNKTSQLVLDLPRQLALLHLER